MLQEFSDNKERNNKNFMMPPVIGASWQFKFIKYLMWKSMRDDKNHFQNIILRLYLDSFETE